MFLKIPSDEAIILISRRQKNVTNKLKILQKHEETLEFHTDAIMCCQFSVLALINSTKAQIQWTRSVTTCYIEIYFRLGDIWIDVIVVRYQLE